MLNELRCTYRRTSVDDLSKHLCVIYAPALFYDMQNAHHLRSKDLCNIITYTTFRKVLRNRSTLSTPRNPHMFELHHLNSVLSGNPEDVEDMGSST